MKYFPKHFYLWMDFTKTFDSIAHNYLFEVLDKLQFPLQFLCTIKNLTYQVSIYIFVDSSVSDIKIPVQRGCRQREPTSGYLFDIVLDIFNKMTMQALQASIITMCGHPILSFMYYNDAGICMDKPETLIQLIKI
eukprot:TRINITY_DN2684_c0_g1_i25.p1 TRINITY_DN2684_c0_g1~~TRINITY_DN2684_c0_g1_i25.p1  ORF type:complete len:135 (+),score=14.53 TRINITY_DN2684_c0_g1_i25:476-880(+)